MPKVDIVISVTVQKNKVFQMVYLSTALVFASLILGRYCFLWCHTPDNLNIVSSILTLKALINLLQILMTELSLLFLAQV